ncbi:Phospholipid-transporting ATPase IB, partial [Quaeritorhiza haematococci]
MNVEPVVAALPLIIITGLTAAKDATEDYRRHRSDQKINTQVARKLSGSWRNSNKKFQLSYQNKSVSTRARNAMRDGWAFLRRFMRRMRRKIVAWWVGKFGSKKCRLAKGGWLGDEKIQPKKLKGLKMGGKRRQKHQAEKPRRGCCWWFFSSNNRRVSPVTDSPGINTPKSDIPTSQRTSVVTAPRFSVLSRISRQYILPPSRGLPSSPSNPISDGGPTLKSGFLSASFPSLRYSRSNPEHSHSKHSDGYPPFSLSSSGSFRKSKVSKASRSTQAVSSIFSFASRQGGRPQEINPQWKDSKWQEVQVGDLVLIRSDEPIPADVLILATSEPDGLCYVETQNLDGETNLKIRYTVPETWQIICALNGQDAFGERDPLYESRSTGSTVAVGGGNRMRSPDSQVSGSKSSPAGGGSGLNADKKTSGNDDKVPDMEFATLRCYLEVESPNPSLYSFTGTLVFPDILPGLAKPISASSLSDSATRDFGIAKELAVLSVSGSGSINGAFSGHNPPKDLSISSVSEAASTRHEVESPLSRTIARNLAALPVSSSSESDSLLKNIVKELNDLPPSKSAESEALTLPKKSGKENTAFSMSASTESESISGTANM